MLSGLDGIAITDHDRLVPAERLAALREKYAPFVIFTGIEVQSEDHHWVVIGIHDSTLERVDWRYADLHRFVRERGGFMILAHPFRYKPEITVDLDGFPPDGIEVKSINTPVSREADIVETAERLGLVMFNNSDAHRPGAIGSYSTEIPQSVQNDQELVEVLTRMKQLALRGEAGR